MSRIDESKRLQDELEFRYKYEKIIHADNLVSKTDIKGNITYVNDEFCEITGYSREELIGQNHRILKPIECNSDNYKTLWKTISSGKTYKTIVRNIAKNGKEIFLSTTISPIVNQNNEIVEYIAIRHDITKEITLQKRLEIEHLKLKKAYEVAKIATWEYNFKTQELDVSPEALKMLQLKNIPKLNLNILNNIIDKDDILKVTKFIQKVSLGIKDEIKCTTKIVLNNEKKYIECQAKKVPNEDKIIGIIQDVTQRINKEEELRNKRRIIAQQSKMATMGEMIANIAHQWRQPLSYITTVATGLKLQKELNNLDDKFFFESLDSVNESAQYLSRTIDDFRNFFAPNKTIHIFDIEKTFEKTLKLVSSQFKNNNIKIESNIRSFNIFGYENELLQVLINILKNAKDELIKCENERLIFIETIQFEEEAIIKIKDNAGGIKKSHLSKIFNPYFTTKKEDEGTGIGLYMCKEIVERNMSGQIKAENETFIYDNNAYKGAIFTITIPLEKKA